MKDSEEFAPPRRWGTLRPKFIIALVAVLIVIGVAAGYFEISQSRHGIMELLREEAETVTEALAISAENAMQSYAEAQALIENNLFNAGLLLSQLERRNALANQPFETLIPQSSIARVLRVNREGTVEKYAYPSKVADQFRPDMLNAFVSPLFAEKLERVAGIVEDKDGRSYYAVAVKNTPQTAWVLCADPDILLNFRKRVGIGRLIQDIGENKEIAYIVLQDENGIISATRNISAMGSLANDPFLSRVFAGDQLESRVTSFEDRDVFEVVKPFRVQGETFGLIRVGLEMQAAKQAVTRTMERAVIVLFGFIVIAVILFNFLIANQNYKLINEAYSKIRTYTGNILEHMADAVIAVNQDGRITLFNRAAEKLFGRNSDEVVGKSCREIIGKQTSLLDVTLSTGRAIRNEEVEYQLNGQKSILSVTTNPLRNKSGEIDSAVAVIKDLTETKAWEQRLRRQEKLTAMGELASGVAHEIRNPLNSISIIAQRFGWEFTPTTNEVEFRELARSVISETKRVSDIIERFLEFARPPKLNLEKHQLEAILKKTITLIESEAKERQIEVRFEAGDRLELQMDANQMEQVFLNLLQNAIHATPAGGEIGIRMFQNGDQAVVEISDTGAGIPPEHLNRVFDLYFTTKEAGTGMGLSLSHRIVSEHGGRIEIESEVGRGSVFRIFLPIGR